MAYYKRKSYKKRSYKKKNFSRFNLYKHRSSKSQAYQIYKLNKKVNYIERKTKPEIDIYNMSMFSNPVELTANNVSSRYYTITPSDDIKGNLMRLQNLQVWGNLNSTSTDNFTAYMRILIVQQKVSDQAILTNILYKPNDILMCKSPLINGFSQTSRLLYDKLYKIDSDNSGTNFKIKLKNLMNIRKRETPLSEVKWDGLISVYVYMISNSAMTVNNVIFGRLAYIDEGGKND